MAKKAATKLKSGPRGRKRSGKYDNSRRSKKSAETQQSVIRTMVELLVKRRGGEVQIEEIARKSGISERSIFRFFKDKQALLEATDTYIMQYMQSTMLKIDAGTVADFGRDVFKLFDANENLLRAYLFSPFGHTARSRLRKKLNQALIEKLKLEAGGSFPPGSEHKVALTVSLINANLWSDLRNDFGMNGEEIGKVISWAVKILAAKLD